MKKLKLNLGCGLDHRKGYINIDALKKLNPDLVHDLHKPLPFKNSQISEIVAQDILEHFTKEDVQNVISEISRVLKNKGKLTVRIPNIDYIIERFSNDKETRNEFLYGTTRNTGIFGAHKVGYTKEYLTTIMLNHNLKLEKIKEVDTNLEAIFIKSNFENKKKLLFINQTLGNGGAEVFISDLLQELKNLSWEINIYSNNDTFIQTLSDKGVIANKINTVVDIVGDWKGLLKGLVLWPLLLIEYLKIFIKHKNSSVFLTSGYIEKIIASPLALLFNIPTAWIEFGPMSSVINRFYKLPKFLYLLVRDIPNKIIVPTFNTRNHLIPEVHISLSKLDVIPCGRNLKGSIPKNKTEKNLVVCVSRLEEGKGQDLLIKAFKKVVKDIPTAKLKIIGEGAFKKDLEKLVIQLRIQKNIELLGRVKDSISEMKKAEIVVFPSVWSLEGFGLVMIEAMSLGKTCIAFNTGPAPEIIENNINGLLAKNNDINNLAQKIIYVLNSKEFAQEYTWDKVLGEYKKLWNRSLN